MPTVTHPCTESNSSTSQRATPKRDLGSMRGRRPSCCRWPQRSGMARGTSTCGSAAGRPPRRAQRPWRQLTTSALLPSRPAPRPPLRLSGSQSHLGEERRGGRGGRRWGRSPKVQLFALVPQAAWPRALCNAALTQGTEHARKECTQPTAQHRCFSFSVTSSPQRPPQSATA